MLTPLRRQTSYKRFEQLWGSTEQDRSFPSLPLSGLIPYSIVPWWGIMRNCHPGPTLSSATFRFSSEFTSVLFLRVFASRPHVLKQYTYALKAVKVTLINNITRELTNLVVGELESRSPMCFHQLPFLNGPFHLWIYNWGSTKGSFHNIHLKSRPHTSCYFENFPCLCW